MFENPHCYAVNPHLFLGSYKADEEGVYTKINCVEDEREAIRKRFPEHFFPKVEVETIGDGSDFADIIRGEEKHHQIPDNSGHEEHVEAGFTIVGIGEIGEVDHEGENDDFAEDGGERGEMHLEFGLKNAGDGAV